MGTVLAPSKPRLLPSLFFCDLGGTFDLRGSPESQSKVFAPSEMVGVAGPGTAARSFQRVR